MKLEFPKQIEKVLGNSEPFISGLFKRPESLSALLPYDEYIHESGLFRHKDGSLGVVFEATLLEHETMTSEQVKDAVNSLKTWFSLPSNCALQVLYDQSFVSPHDKLFQELKSQYPSANSVSKRLYEERLSRLQNSCNTKSSLAPFSRRLFVSLRYFPDEGTVNLKTLGMKRGEAVLFKEMKEFIRESRTFLQIATDFQHYSAVPLRKLGAGEVLDVLRRFFNPKTYYKRPFAPYNPNCTLSDQVIYNNPTLDYPGLEREGIKTRTLSLKTSPQYAYPGGMAYFTKLNFPFKLSLNFKFPTKRQTKTFFDVKEFFLQNTPSARARRQHEEVLQVQERLARDDRCLHLTFNVILEGETDEILESRVRDVVNVFHNDLECETILEDDIGLGLALNALPLNYTPKSDYSSQRFIRILKSDATKFTPIFDSFRGLKKPLQLFLSRENNLVPFSLLENETSNHTVVLADSGSGKSAFVIDCIQAMKRMDPEPLVFVIDKKSSYVMASEYFEGNLTVFDAAKEMPFTPFRGVYDESKIAMLTQILLSGIKLTSPHVNFDSTHQSAIAYALKLAYEKKVHQAGLSYIEGELQRKTTFEPVELSMDDFIAELARLPSEKEFENATDTVDALLKYLMPFYGDGLYAKYFRSHGKSKYKPETLLYAYDLDRLDTDPVLQSLMTMAVCDEICQIIKRPEHQGRAGVIIFEEMGMLGRNNPIASQFAIDFAETSRKLGYLLISLTPRPQNYFELEVGKAMWSVADNFLFLQMSADNVEYLAKHSAILDEASREIIKSLRTKRGEFADIFYMNKKKTRQGAFRYFQTPLDMWLAPTNAKDAREAVKALKEFKNHKWQALEYLAKTFPQGVETALEKTGGAK